MRWLHTLKRATHVLKTWPEWLRELFCRPSVLPFQYYHIWTLFCVSTFSPVLQESASSTLTLLSVIEAVHKGSQLNVFENLQPVDNFNLQLPCSSANTLHTSRNFISVFRGHLKAPAEKSRDIQAMQLSQYLGKLNTLHMKAIWILTFRFLQLAFKISTKCLSLHLSILNNIPSKSCTFVATSFIDRVGGLVAGAYIGVMVLMKLLTRVAIHVFGGGSRKQFSLVLTPWNLSSMLKFLHPTEVTEPQIRQCGSYKVKMAKLLQRP